MWTRPTQAFLQNTGFPTGLEYFPASFLPPRPEINFRRESLLVNQDFNYRLSSFERQFPFSAVVLRVECICARARVCVCVCLCLLVAFGCVQHVGFLDILCIVTACAEGLAACKTVFSPLPPPQPHSLPRSGDIT